MEEYSCIRLHNTIHHSFILRQIGVEAHYYSTRALFVVRWREDVLAGELKWDSGVEGNG